MKICHIVPSLAERHGGPSKSVRALASHAVAAGAEVDLLATQIPGESLAPRADDHARIRVFPRIFPRWLVRSPELNDHLQETRYTCIHHHSLWLLSLRYAAGAAQRRGVPLVISPRGMMSPWAWNHHRWRKRLAEKFVHPDAFQLAAGWHATSAEEAFDIHTLGFRQPVCVSPNGVTIPTESDLAAARGVWEELCPAVRSRPVALFYSRFHRKKRVRELIDLWLGPPRGDWLLLIIGTAEDYSPAKLAEEVANLGASDRIAVLDGAGRPPPYAVASLFLLPSHSENFGQVIAEALAAGVPPLVTDTTPWSDLGPNRAGWCVSWNDYGRTLTEALVVPPDDLRAMGRLGRNWVARDFSWTRAAGLLHGFYRHLAHE
ncbi:MAG TPA: glycosyltransferase [Lacunisphaera sp.]|nr:glycosyltransferase [Lacunisphaera sp.]